MSELTEQLREWKHKLGKEYTDRNAISLDDLEALYRRNYGIARTELNKLFLHDMDRSIKILEVGCNIGNQLLCLQKMGFNNLYGIEPNNHAAELLKIGTSKIDIIEGDIFNIPFKDRHFDLVFTSGVLIHISPLDIKRAMKEIYRCTDKYIWGFEYYSEEYKEIIYRGRKSLLWKADFPKLYTDIFHDSEIMKIKFLKYLENDNIDVMFLLRKEGV